MSVLPEVVTRMAPTPSRLSSDRRLPLWAWLVIGLALISLVRIITGAHEMTATGTLREMLLSMVPIALAGLGGLWSERAGVVNIGLEGMMILGALGAGYFGIHHGAWAGLIGGIAFGVIGGLIHAVATVTFGVDHIVSGVAVTIVATGAAGYLAESWFAELEGGGPTQSPPLPGLGTFDWPMVSEWAADLQQKHWFVISDLASVLGALTRDLPILTPIALLAVLVSGWLLWRTSFGLRLRACGESPAAAETLGVNVVRYKFGAVLISGAMAGMAGAFMSLAWVGFYQDGMTGGRGYIGLAAMIFGNWRPGGLLIGAALFGYTDALQLRAGGGAVHGLLLLIAIVVVAYGIYQLMQGARRSGTITLAIGAAIAAWFVLTDEVPEDFTTMTPYVATLFVLAFAAQRLRMPAADGLPYRKGSSG